MSEQEILNREEVAALLGIAPQSLTNRIARGGPFPPYREISPRCRVWLRSDVESWISAIPKRTSGLRRPRNYRAAR